MNAASALLRNEPVWLQALVLALVSLAGRFGFHLGADQIVELNLVAYALTAIVTRKFTSPAKSAAIPPAAGQSAELPKEQTPMSNTLAQDLAEAWKVIKPLIPMDQVAAEADAALTKIETAINGGIDAELAKVVPAAFEPEVVAVVNEGLNLVEQAVRSGMDAKLKTVGAARAVVGGA